MGKVLNTYRSYSAAELKSRADIPSQGDIAVNASDIDCSNISLMAVSDLIWAVASIPDVCTSPNVNQWSCFGPKIRSYSNRHNWDSLLVNSNPSSNFSLGSFAGYNHGAIEPNGFNTPSIIMIDAGTKADVWWDAEIGEIIYPLSQGLAFVVFDSVNSIIAWEVQNINDSGFFATGSVITTDDIYLDQTGCKCGIYIIDQSSLSGSGDIQASVLCKVPNTSLRDLAIYIKVQTKMFVDGVEFTGQPTITSGDFVFSSPGFSTSTNSCTVSDVLNQGVAQSNVRLYAVLMRQNGPGTSWEVVEEVEMYEGPLGSMARISDYGAFTNVVTFNETFAGYGYLIQIYLDESV